MYPFMLYSTDMTEKICNINVCDFYTVVRIIGIFYNKFLFFWTVLLFFGLSYFFWAVLLNSYFFGLSYCPTFFL